MGTISSNLKPAIEETETGRQTFKFSKCKPSKKWAGNSEFSICISLVPESTEINISHLFDMMDDPVKKARPSGVSVHWQARLGTRGRPWHRG